MTELPQPLCVTNCPFHRAVVDEVAGQGDVLKVFCRLNPEKELPILVIAEMERVQHFVAMAEMRIQTHYSGRFCIAPNQRSL